MDLYNEQDIRTFNARQSLENDMFEHFLVLYFPNDQLLQSSLEGSESSGPGGAGAAPQSEGALQRQKSRCSISERIVELNLEWKLHIAHVAIKEIQQDWENLRRRHERLQDNHKSCAGEMDLCVAEVSKVKKDLKHRLIKPMTDSREIQTPEKVEQSLQDHSKAAELDKFNLRGHSLNIKINNIQKQLRLKSQKGQNEYDEEIIQEKTEQRPCIYLEEIKFRNWKAFSRLGKEQEKLRRGAAEIIELGIKIKNRVEMLKRLEDFQQTEADCLKTEVMNKNLCSQQLEYEAPDIVEYMQLKDKRKMLRQKIRIMERKNALEAYS